MSLVVPWLVFPLVLGALCLGCGLLLGRLSGTRLHAVLLLPARIRRDRRRRRLDHVQRNDGAVHNTVRRRPCRRGPGAVAAVAPAPGHPLALRCRRGHVRRVRPARADDRRPEHPGIHRARRHGHVAGVHRPADDARPVAGRPRAVHVSGRARLVLAAERLPDGRLPAARRGTRARRNGFGLVDPALRLLRSRTARALPLRAPALADPVAAAQGAGRLHRRAACAPLRLCPLGRPEGGTDGRVARARRHPHAARRRRARRRTRFAAAGDGGRGDDRDPQLRGGRLARPDPASRGRRRNPPARPRVHPRCRGIRRARASCSLCLRSWGRAVSSRRPRS